MPSSPVELDLLDLSLHGFVISRNCWNHNDKLVGIFLLVMGNVTDLIVTMTSFQGILQSDSS